ncbi:MAG TPA: AAA domain-containing protein, partial [Oligoflexia bacterium]|nr:AAA domain-containing protein [Oligoflexia bacterium]
FLHFSARKEPARCDYSLAKRVLARSAVRHLGQFGSKFALAPSQRLAVHRFMETPPGDFLCVTGPPGTGKTTMLQSIIASLWVQAASAGAHPPVIVCTAASNQAVTNIIDSLEKGGMEQDVLSQRWLPGVHSFGTFCSSAGRAKENAAYQLELRNGSGLSAEMTRAEYLRKAKESFLASFASWRGEQSSLAKAVKILRAELQRERSALHRDVMLAANGTLLEWLRSLVGLQQRRSWMDLFEVLPKFDQTRRHRMFLLAAHYWEGRWLAETQRELSRKRRKDADNVRFSGETAVWRRRAMITPAFVSTLSMVPRFFAARDNRDEPPIDVLIFDEAGQIPVEAGVACSCLAKCAVIVGDCEQLEPVWNVPPHIDRADALRCGVLRKNDETEWGSLVRRGISASCGSFMYLGLRSTKWTERSTYGVFLSEHRRSVPQIVGFANALAYRGRLEPLRPDLPSRILPPFGYVHVPGTCQQHGESRYNRREAETIASWLLREERRLCDFYRKPDLSGLVAVITPFAAQTRRLEAKLWPRWPKLVVGTVNSLQGAERPVVLFSAVYDRTFRGRYFFDRGRNMLNVAVSRAQDTFIVFADMEIFNPEGQAPSSVLAQWLYSNPAYELTEVEVPPREDMPAEETTRIVTLAGHQEVLSGAFEGAKREVLISSPTISSAAIVKDNITALIQAARQRGVSVRVFTDADLDAPNGELKPNAAKGRALLAEAGAEVIVVKAIHNKALAVDDHTLVEGSFNWLSAVRTEGSVHQKLEVSWCYRGPKAREAIILLRDELEHRAGLLV